MDSRLLDWAVAGRPRAGEAVSGDRHLIAPFPGGVLVALIDGLGHGREAEAAARAAADALSEYPERPVDALVARCHEALARFRGVVLGAASFHAWPEATMTWIGVGNVKGVVVRSGEGGLPAPLAGASSRPGPGRSLGASRERLLVLGGIVGRRLGPLRPRTMHIAAADTLILATDGVRADFVDEAQGGEPVQAVADGVLARYATGGDDALVLAARYAPPAEVSLRRAR